MKFNKRVSQRVATNSININVSNTSKILCLDFVYR
jgi:hypothetical protein